MTTKNFLGIPIDGDITPGAGRAEQQPIEDFAPILQAVLDDPTVVEFGWRQCTPYFNDGEPCEFSAYGVWVRTTADSEDLDDDGLDVDYGHPSLGEMTGGAWVDDPENPGRRKKVGERYEGPDLARFERAKALGRAVDGGHFLNVLLDAFGDHARVTVRGDGIQVDFYEHD